MQRTGGRPCDEFRVIVVDENPFDGRATESTLAKSNFHVMVYTSPIKALNFLEDHEQDVDFVLVSVHMKEMHGFQFLDMSREMHKNLQVIMMSTEATWPIMQRCVDLGARFLVKKPLDTIAIRNIWQYLDQRLLRMEKIKTLFKGIRGNTYGVNCSGKGLENTLNKCGEGTSSKKSAHLIWTPFLQNKFLQAVELLGDAATPKKIEMLMNVNSIDRKKISAHLQKHRKRVDKELKHSMVSKISSKNASSSKPLKTWEGVPENNDIQREDRTVTESIIRETEGNKVYEGMRKALQLGTMYDEQLSSDDPSSEEAEQGEDGIAQENADSAKEVSNKTDSDEAGVVKLVTYSDSEDDEDVRSTHSFSSEL